MFSRRRSDALRHAKQAGQRLQARLPAVMPPDVFAPSMPQPPAQTLVLVEPASRLEPVLSAGGRENMDSGLDLEPFEGLRSRQDRLAHRQCFKRLVLHA